eukprot:gene5584-15688_t
MKEQLLQLKQKEEKPKSNLPSYLKNIMIALMLYFLVPRLMRRFGLLGSSTPSKR